MSRFVKSLENNKDAIEVFDTIKEMYYFIKDWEGFRASKSQFTVTDDNHHIVDQEFPLIAEFREKYKMSNFMLVMEYSNPNFYTTKPHSHNIENTTGSIFWPIVYSKYAATSFYLPPEETIVDRNVKGANFKLKESNWDKPEETVQLQYPTVFHMNHFHRPVALEDHADNAKRVVCNWEAKSGVSYEELSELLS